MTQTLQIFVQNPYQDLGRTNYTGFSNNLSFKPTVEELNRTASSGEVSQGSSAEDGDDEPLFGKHIREAATTVRKLFGSR